MLKYPVFAAMALAFLCWCSDAAQAVELAGAVSQPSAVVIPTQSVQSSGAAVQSTGFTLVTNPIAGRHTQAGQGGSGSFQPVSSITLNSSAGLTIVINAGATLAANTDALAAFQRAADQWASRLADPITVTIDADLADLGSGSIIGQASSVSLWTDYSSIRNAMVADSAVESDDGIVASLPTAAQFSATVPTAFVTAGVDVGVNMSATKANLKALGFTGLDGSYGATDATIEFNTNFAFDYDNTDGVTGGTIDFETVAAHEIGHALGFVSEVDYVDYLLSLGATAEVMPTPLDLFRFEDGSNPDTEAEFTTEARYLSPGGDPITDFVLGPWGTLTDVELAMSSGAYTGDGRQASHWLDGLLAGGDALLMDPTLSYGSIVAINEADFRALDLIGWDITDALGPDPGTGIPEPSAALLAALAAMALLPFGWRRRRAA